MKVSRVLLVFVLASPVLLCGGYAVAQKSGAHAAAKPKPAAAAKPASTPAPAESSAPDTSKPAAPAAPASSGQNVVAQESHIEFDERMVHGQTAAGAIYLFQRSPSDFKSMVGVPDSFRKRTTDLLAPRRATP